LDQQLSVAGETKRLQTNLKIY